MRHRPLSIVFAICLVGAAAHAVASNRNQAPDHAPAAQEATMELGNFSISLAVKDIAVSRAFYEKLGFSVVHGNQDQNWLILQNATATIGLFQGMFDKNILTFNPGWTRDMQTLDGFEDVRTLQRQVKEKGIIPVTEADEATTGPASFVIVDPDGNPILIDQHVNSPASR